MDNKNFKKEFGQKVRQLRKLANISQEKLAESAGLSTKTISYIENSKNTISFNKLPLIANALGVPVYKLFVFSDFSNDTDTRKELEELLNSATEKELRVISDITKSVLSLK